MEMKKNKNLLRRLAGFSLVEMLVVLAVFAILGVSVSQVLVVILRSARKSDTSTKVRSSIDFAVSTIERQLHNATAITPCPNPDNSTITVTDQNSQTYNFSCITPGANGYVASGSARITPDDVSITACTFICSAATASVPPSVTINLTAQDSTAKNAENTIITNTTKIYLRSY